MVHLKRKQRYDSEKTINFVSFKDTLALLEFDPVHFHTLEYSESTDSRN